MDLPITPPGAIMDEVITCTDSLINRNQSPWDTKRAFLLEAAKIGDAETVTQLLDSGIAPDFRDKRGWNAVHWAAFNGDVGVLNILLGISNKRVTPDTLNSALLIAVLQGHLQCVRTLLEAGAQVDTSDDTDGCSALQKGIMAGHLDVVEELLSRGASVDHRSRDGKMPLHYASSKDNPSFVTLLLDKGAVVTSSDHLGRSPLHYAALYAFSDTAVTLLRNGADMWQEDKTFTKPIYRLPCSTLEAYFDECILSDEESKGFLEEPHVMIKYDVIQKSRDNKPEYERLEYFAFSHRHKRLLKHPLLYSFITLRWKRVLPIFLLKFVTFTAYLAASTLCVLSLKSSTLKLTAQDTLSTAAPTTDTLGQSHPVWEFAVKVLLLVLCLGEVTQFLSTSWRYLISFENYIEVASYSMAIAVLYLDDVWIISRRGCAILWPLLAWLQFGLMIGRFPIFTRYIAMFSKVAYNYVRFLFPFTAILAGFVLSFYLTFNLCVTDNCTELYRSFPISVLKTTVMMMGEMDLVDFPYGNMTPYTFTLVFLFIFLIMLVLMNLLNALAVSDAQQIADEAEIYAINPLLHMVCDVEAFFCPKTRNKYGPLLSRFKKVAWMFSRIPLVGCFGRALNFVVELLTVPDRPIAVNLRTGSVNGSHFFPVPENVVRALNILVDKRRSEAVAAQEMVEYKKILEEIKEIQQSVSDMKKDLKKALNLEATSAKKEIDQRETNKTRTNKK